MSAVVVVPYRDDPSSQRRANAETVLKWLSSLDVSVVLSELSEEPDTEISLPDGVSRIHTFSDGAFNKAQACNAGFLHTTDDVVAFVDADTVMDSRIFKAALRRLESRDEVIRPFSSLVDLTLEETLSYFGTGLLPEPASTQRNDLRDGDVIPLCGGMVLMRRERFFSVGGYDERFQGWGGEDDALSFALIRTGATIMVMKEVPAFHLWHDRDYETRAGHEHYGRNVSFSRWWQSAEPSEIREEIAYRKLLLRQNRGL